MLFFFFLSRFFLAHHEKENTTERTGPLESADSCLILGLPNGRQVEASSPTASADYKRRRKDPIGRCCLFFCGEGKDFMSGFMPEFQATIAIFFNTMATLLKKKKKSSDHFDFEAPSTPSRSLTHLKEKHTSLS